MKYDYIWNKILNPEEKIEHEFSVAKRYINVNLIIWAIILLLAFIAPIILFPIVWFYFKFYIPRANAYALTDKRLLVHRGWLSTGAISIDYDKITDIIVKEPFWDKVLYKTGNLAINTAGSIGHEVVLAHIDVPYEIKKKIYEIKSA